MKNPAQFWVKINNPDATEWDFEHPASVNNDGGKTDQEVRGTTSLVESDEIRLVTKEALGRFLSLPVSELDDLLSEGLLEARHVFRIGRLTRYNLISIVRDGFRRRD